MASTAAAPPPVVLDKVSQTLFTLTNNAGTPARRTAQWARAMQTMLTPTAVLRRTVVDLAVLPAWLLLAFAPTWTYTFTVVHAAALVNAVVYVFLLVSEMPESRRQAKRTAPRTRRATRARRMVRGRALTPWRRRCLRERMQRTKPTSPRSAAS